MQVVELLHSRGMTTAEVLQLGSIVATLCAVAVAFYNAQVALRRQGKQSLVQERREAAYLAVSWMNETTLAIENLVNNHEGRPSPDVATEVAHGISTNYRPVHARLALLYGKVSPLRDSVRDAEIAALAVVNAIIEWALHGPQAPVASDAKYKHAIGAWAACSGEVYNRLAAAAEFDVPRWEVRHPDEM